MTTEQPDPKKESENQTDVTDASYLKEALRLIELRIDYQDKVFIAIERKAVLLVTLYIATIGYMLSWEIWKTNYCVIAITVVLIFFLVVSALIGASVLYPRYFGGPGANPEYLIKRRKYGLHEMKVDLLEDKYKETANTNESTIEKKMWLLGISLWLGIGTIVFACVFRIIIGFLKISI